MGIRRGGAISLVRSEVDPKRQTVRLTEKGDIERELPVTADLLEEMLRHSDERGGGAGPMFRYANGNPLTRRRYNYMFERVHASPPFPSATQISIHWARHTALTNLERVSSESVAANFAGHQPYRSSVTGLYTTSAMTETVDAWCRVWGTTHPLMSSGSPASA